MTLSEAIEILKIEKGVSDLDISNGTGSLNDEKFSLAVDVVTEFVDRCVSMLMRLNQYFEGDSMGKEDFERMKALEEKRDNCTITENEEKELTYLIWKYTN